MLTTLIFVMCALPIFVLLTYLMYRVWKLNKQHAPLVSLVTPVVDIPFEEKWRGQIVLLAVCHRCAARIDMVYPRYEMAKGPVQRAFDQVTLSFNSIAYEYYTWDKYVQQLFISNGWNYYSNHWFCTQCTKDIRLLDATIDEERKSLEALRQEYLDERI